RNHRPRCQHAHTDDTGLLPRGDCRAVAETHVQGRDRGRPRYRPHRVDRRGVRIPGPNGAGKTTTVRMLCTLLPPTAGSATVAGLDVVNDAAEVRRRIGVALQEIGLDPVQTGRELLELQCGLYGITGPRARVRTQELLELVGLTDAADRRTKTYSGGMKRRLDLASGLVHSPEVLFLDEPTTGLDPASRRTVWDE